MSEQVEQHHVYGNWEYQPPRSSGIRCSVCRRPFAAGAVPPSTADNRGLLVKVCRDCRAEWEAKQHPELF